MVPGNREVVSLVTFGLFLTHSIPQSTLDNHTEAIWILSPRMLCVQLFSHEQEWRKIKQQLCADCLAFILFRFSFLVISQPSTIYFFTFVQDPVVVNLKCYVLCGRNLLVEAANRVWTPSKPTPCGWSQSSHWPASLGVIITCWGWEQKIYQPH